MPWFWPFNTATGDDTDDQVAKPKQDIETGDDNNGMQKKDGDEPSRHEVICRAARRLCRRVYWKDLNGFRSILNGFKPADVTTILLQPLEKVRIGKRDDKSAISVFNFPLGFTMETGSFQICEFLINRLKNDERHIFKSNQSTHTAIHCAAINSDPEVFKLLIKYNIVDEKNINIESANGNTPLHYACYCNIKDAKSADMVDLLLESGAGYDKQNNAYELPLHWAALGGNLKKFDAIYNKYREADIKLYDGKLSAARECVKKKWLEEKKNISPEKKEKQLEDEAIKIVVTENNKNFGEDCLKIEAPKLGVPLLFAAKNQHFDCIAQIFDLQREADGTVRDDECDTALHFVSRSANPEQLAKILKANALLGAKNEVGNTPLDWISPDTMEEVLDNHIQRIDKHVTKSDVSTKDQYEILFTNLFGHHASGSDIKNILALATSDRHQELALHPVCQSVLSAKWQKMKKYFLIKLLFFIPFIVLLSMYPVLVNDLEHSNDTLTTSILD